MYSSSSFFLHRITRSYRKHSCSTDYSRNLNGFGLAAIGLAPYRLACNCPIMAGFFSAIGGIATTVRSSFRLNSVRNPWSKNVPFLPRNPMNMNESEHPFLPRNPMNMNEYAIR